MTSEGRGVEGQRGDNGRGGLLLGDFQCEVGPGCHGYEIRIDLEFLVNNLTHSITGAFFDPLHEAHDDRIGRNHIAHDPQVLAQ